MYRDGGHNIDVAKIGGVAVLSTPTFCKFGTPFPKKMPAPLDSERKKNANNSNVRAPCTQECQYWYVEGFKINLIKMRRCLRYKQQIKGISPPLQVSLSALSRMKEPME